MNDNKNCVALLTCCDVNSAVLCEAGVARQRDAGYRHGGIRYSGDSDMWCWVYPAWRQLDSNAGVCGRQQLGHME